MDWDTLFMSEAYLIASKSKDQSTQVGACVVGTDHDIRVKGFNGPPRGFNDDAPDVQTRPLKYLITVHAEENCVATAAKRGISLDGCTLYSFFHPCSRCACSLVQAGIIEVVCHTEFPGAALAGQWEQDRLIATRIFAECNVAVRWWSGTPIISTIRCNGLIHSF